ncbi:MAG: hypothetical protein CTY33_05085 [Methylotenera sp.]|nr:MAG: hypothetical protein CTY33_05085 [Methylotenera sp.]
MAIISDEELITYRSGAESESASDLFHFLVGSLERGNLNEIDDYLSRHQPNPKIASTIAEVLYEKNAPRENYEKWYEYMRITALGDEGMLSGEACLDLAIEHYDKAQYDEAYEWATRAVVDFKIPEAAFMLGSIHEIDPDRLDLVKAAELFILTPKLISKAEPDFRTFKYFDDEDLPVNLEGQWEDFELLGEYLAELALPERNELLDLVKTTKPFR